MGTINRRKLAERIFPLGGALLAEENIRKVPVRTAALIGYEC
jgi:hypothetical protein